MDGSIDKESEKSQSIESIYKMGNKLGSGSFGEVKLAVHRLTDIQVAIKILKRESFNNNNSAEEKVRREINILKLLSHPHIVRLFEVIETRSEIYLVMEYMSSGDLYDYLTCHGRLQEAKARYFFQQIISGVEFCHLHMVVHRDLKAENLLVDSEDNVKLADFGLGNVMRDGHFLKTSCGSLNYSAPEILADQLYAGPEVDVWSCGIILYALLCAVFPFDDANISALLAKIKRGIYTLPHHLSPGVRDLISRILVVDPINRMSIPEIRKHPWFCQQVPRHIVVRPIKASYNATRINEEIVEDMVKLGCDRSEVVDSLRKGVHNQATVAYSLMLHKRFGVQYNQHNDELLGCLPEECTDRSEVYLRSSPPSQRKWALGFQSIASPQETMNAVLCKFGDLNVRWKKIGNYNVKCLWLPRELSISGKCYEDNSKTTSLRRMNIGSPQVKFEIQLYKASSETYALDLQRTDGPPFLFLEICAAFFSLVVA